MANTARAGVRNVCLILVGVACLAIGLLATIGMLVDVDYLIGNYPAIVPSFGFFVETLSAIVLLGVGPWCLFRAIRSMVAHR